MRPLLALALMTVLLAACGQTGPLYLPNKEMSNKEMSGEQPAPPADTAPATETQAAPATGPAVEAK